MPDINGGKEVAFDVKDLSRATTTTTFDHFAVYGDVKNAQTPNAEPITTFDKTIVEKSNGSWTYKDAQYWFPGHEHSFVAIHPLSVLEAGNNPQYSSSNLSFAYSLPLSDDGHVNDMEVDDIVAATYRRLYSEASTNSTVYLTFAHLLSQINFTIELTEPATRSEQCFKIHKIEMSGFGTSATINVKPASRLDNTQTSDSEIDIVTAKGNGSIERSFDEPIEVTYGDAAVQLFASNDAIIMLPQTIAADEKVQVLLTYSVNDETEPTTVTASLWGLTWESGRNYNYKITLEIEEEKEAIMVINGATIEAWELVNHNEVGAH